jgi:hypothetical protein
MTSLQSRTHGTLYLAIAKLMSENNPELAQQMTAAQLADLMAESQDIMDATTPGQVATIADMLKLVGGKS